MDISFFHISSTYRYIIFPKIRENPIQNGWWLGVSPWLGGNLHKWCISHCWLVVGPPLWNIWKSIGMMTFPIYGKIKDVNQTTNQIKYIIFPVNICPLNFRIFHHGHLWLFGNLWIPKQPVRLSTWDFPTWDYQVETKTSGYLFPLGGSSHES